MPRPDVEAIMRICWGCQREIPSFDDLRRERRRDRTHSGIVYILLLAVGISIGYLVRDGVFLKRENSVLWSLLDGSMKKVQIDKVVDEKNALRAKLRKQKQGE